MNPTVHFNDDPARRVQAGAAATLTGLVFVVVSINLARIISVRACRGEPLKHWRSSCRYSSLRPLR